MRAKRILILMVCLALTGCSGAATNDIPAGHKVSGKVLAPDGQVLTGGRLILMPLDKAGFPAFGNIQKNGTFTLTNQKAEPSAVAGKYKVYVTTSDNNLRSRIPRRYLDSDTGASNVEVSIANDTSNLEIRLKK